MFVLLAQGSAGWLGRAAVVAAARRVVARSAILVLGRAYALLSRGAGAVRTMTGHRLRPRPTPQLSTACACPTAPRAPSGLHDLIGTATPSARCSPATFIVFWTAAMPRQQRVGGSQGGWALPAHLGGGVLAFQRADSDAHGCRQSKLGLADHAATASAPAETRRRSRAVTAGAEGPSMYSFEIGSPR